MDLRTRRRWLLVIGTTAVIVLVMAAIWAVAPEDLRGLLLVIGGVFYAATVVGGYVIERRLHW
jgi:hypothetical protein